MVDCWRSFGQMRPQHQVRAQSPNRRVTFETPNLEYQLMQVTLNSPLRTEFSPSSPSVYSPQRVPSPKPFIPPIYTPPRALKPNLPTPIPVARAIEAAASTAVPRKRIVVVNTSQFASPPRRVSDAMKDALGRQRLQPSASSPTNTEDNNELVFSPKTPSSPTLSGIMKGQTFTLLFGPTLARSDGKFLFSSQLSVRLPWPVSAQISLNLFFPTPSQKLQFVVLFFGANWCEASVKFSAVLKSFREKAREKGVKLEVVFCSVDR